VAAGKGVATGVEGGEEGKEAEDGDDGAGTVWERTRGGKNRRDGKKRISRALKRPGIKSIRHAAVV